MLRNDVMVLMIMVVVVMEVEVMVSEVKVVVVGYSSMLGIIVLLPWSY